MASRPPSSSSDPHMSAAVRRNAPLTSFSHLRVKLEPLEEEEEAHEAHQRTESIHRVKMEEDDFIIKQEEDQEEEEEEEEEEADREAGRRKRQRKESKGGGGATIRADHRRRLDALLDASIRQRRRRDAAGVLSVLLLAAPSSYNISEDALTKYLTAAMELHRQFIGSEDRRYQMWVRQIYNVWMSQISQSKDDSKKKNALLMGLALFYFTHGNIGEAHENMQHVIQDHDLANEPYVNLLHGMILYQLWYSGLPEEFKIKGFNICTPVECEVAFSNDYQGTEIGEGSNNNYAADTEAFKYSFPYASKSSVGKGKKVSADCTKDIHKIGLGASRPPREFYMSHSADVNEPKSGPRNLDDNLKNSSIFFSNGLDTSLLPIRLQHLTGDPEQLVHQFRNLANGQYANAVKHLRLALQHSVCPVYAALLPLIQLLLLGDRVGEAVEELENSCQNMDSALPFRLMARLLECFQSSKVNQICSYYEKALRRDPICYYSLESLLKMHKSGNCSSTLMFEMISLHLDVADGKCEIWEEFTSCFLRLQVSQTEYEDCISTNVQRELTPTVLANKIPDAFTKEDSRTSWKLRFKWWKRRHFSNSSLPEQGVGDAKLLCFKAACASHLYGPRFEYVVKVCRRLREDSDIKHALILNNHMLKAMNLCKYL